MSMRLGTEGGHTPERDVSLGHTTNETEGVSTPPAEQRSESRVKAVGLRVMTELTSHAGDTLDFRHKLSMTDFTSTPGVRKLVENILSKLTLVDHCVERGHSAEDIQRLAAEKYGGDMEMAAASILKENIDRWTAIERVLGSDVGLEAMQADTLARQALALTSGIVRDDTSGISFIKEGEEVFVIDSKAMAEGSFKTAVKVVEYFTGRKVVFLQASDSPITRLKAQEDMAPKKSLEERVVDRIEAAGDHVSFMVEGAPLGFLEDILDLVIATSNQDAGEISTGTASEASVAVKAISVGKIQEESEMDSGSPVIHEVDTGSVVFHPDRVDEGADAVAGGTVVDRGSVVKSVAGADAVASGTVIDRRSVVTGSVVDRRAVEAPPMPDFMKYMNLGVVNPRTLGAGDEVDQELKDWKREIELYKTLADVPHTAKLRAVIEVADNPYSGMMMEPCDGELGDFVLESKVKLALGEMTWSEYKAQSTSILADAAEHYAGEHALGIINRDIKEGNIMTAAGQGVVSDFGTAIRLTELSPLTEYAGTPIYSAPETAIGKPTTSSDVWSFAIVMYSALVGPVEKNPILNRLSQDCNTSNPHSIIRALKKLAFSGNNELKLEYQELCKTFDSGDERLDDFFSKAFSLDPGKRPTMEEAHALLRILAEESKETGERV